MQHGEAGNPSVTIGSDEIPSRFLGPTVWAHFPASGDSLRIRRAVWDQGLCVISPVFIFYAQMTSNPSHWEILVTIYIKWCQRYSLSFNPAISSRLSLSKCINALKIIKQRHSFHLKVVVFWHVVFFFFFFPKEYWSWQVLALKIYFTTC